jgi:hypothetical protein
MTALLGFATIADLLLAVLLISVSGLFFGDGPEGMGGDALGVSVWTGSLFACFAARVIGFVLRHFAKRGIGALVASAPVVAFLLYWAIY